MRYNKIRSLFVFLILVFTTIQLGAAEDINGKGAKLNKADGSPSRTHFNINNISTWIYNNGDSDIKPDGNSGFIFPKGSNLAAVFESGFVWGAEINGEKRVGGSTYSQGLLPGRVLPNGQREVGQEGDRVRIFRVRPDWATGDMSAEINDGEGTEEEIRAQYQLDWNEWPAEYGAPYEDVDGNGQYNADTDIPGFPGSDQTIWYVANDLDTSTARSLYGSDPMGVEIQATFWGYKSSSALGNTMFRKYTIINKSQDTFENMYVSMWSDPDVGGAGDDFSGCDVDLSLMFTYNGDNSDAAYGETPPAVGFDFFQGPIVAGEPEDEAIFNNQKVAGFKNLPMSVHYFFINSDPVFNDPDLGDYVGGTLQFHNLFRGLITTTGTPFVDPTTNEATKFTLYGDPVTGSGWVDGILHPPGDRRQGMVAGPFDMAPGETQEVVVAELAAGAFGTVDRIGAVQLLKFYDLEAQSAYDNFFQIPKAPAAPVVSVAEMDEEVVLSWDNDKDVRDAIESYDDLGYKFQGYVVYQYPSASAAFEDAKLVATYDLIDGIGKVIGPQFDVTGGVVLDKVLKFGEDKGVKRSISITGDAFNGGARLNNGTPYYFAVTSYCVNEDLSVVPNYLESELIVKEVIPQNVTPGEIIEASTGDAVEVVHNGTANASVTVNVADPKAVTGDEYEIFFDEQHYYLDKDGIWKETAYPDSVGKLGKPGDQTPSTLIPMPSIFAPNNTLDIHFTVDIQAPDFNWSDGVKITFPDGININSAADAGNNHVLSPVIDGQTVTWGSPDTSTDGGFSGGEDLMINIDFVEPTFTVQYEIYDDGWSKFYLDATGDSIYYNLGAGTVHGSGSVTLTGETGYQFKTEQHWNVRDVTTGDVVLDDQRIFSGVNIYTGEEVGTNAATIFDGLQANVDGSFEAPTSLGEADYSGTATQNANGEYVITDYGIQGWAASGRSIDAFGNGTTSIDELQKDYELRYTGEYVDPNADVIYVKEGTGSVATIYGARGYDLADHPMNPNPGSNDPFLIRIPFEVWNVDDNQQVNLLIYDRNQSPTNVPFYAIDPNLSNDGGYGHRTYAEINNTPYDPNTVNSGDPGNSDTDNLTWNLVIRGNNWVKGDVVKLIYNNPIQLGKDTFTFTAPAFKYDAAKAAEDVKEINVFPNPYYGVNPNEINKYQRYVTFNHLPPRATIRIFNLGGQLVKTVAKDDASQFARWDLSNENGLPAASGVYIAYIDMPDLGKTKILKVAIIAETQVLDRF